MTPTALVLRNYGCTASELVARWLSRALGEQLYGFNVDPNERQDFPQGTDPDGVPRWFPFAKERIRQVDVAIFVLSAGLNMTAPGGPSGAGLLTELLEIALGEDAGIKDKVQFILVDCGPDDLRQPKGFFEQLQDIVVPLVKELGFISVDSAATADGRDGPADVVAAVAARMRRKRTHSDGSP